MSKINITKAILTFLPIFFLFGILGYAQEELKDKINNIDGDVDKRAIWTSGLPVSPLAVAYWSIISFFCVEFSGIEMDYIIFELLTQHLLNL